MKSLTNLALSLTAVLALSTCAAACPTLQRAYSDPGTCQPQPQPQPTFGAPMAYGSFQQPVPSFGLQQSLNYSYQSSGGFGAPLYGSYGVGLSRGFYRSGFGAPVYSGGGVSLAIGRRGILGRRGFFLRVR